MKRKKVSAWFYKDPGPFSPIQTLTKLMMDETSMKPRGNHPFHGSPEFHASQDVWNVALCSMRGGWDLKMDGFLLSWSTGLVPLPHNLKIAAHICLVPPPRSTPSVPGKDKGGLMAEKLPHTEPTTHSGAQLRTSQPSKNPHAQSVNVKCRVKSGWGIKTKCFL